MNFNYPAAFLLLLIVPLIFFKRSKNRGALLFSDMNTLKQLQQTFKLRNYVFFTLGFRLIALLLLITALARPRRVNQYTWDKSKGIDIFLTVDVSSSMKAEDFELYGQTYSRLEVVKKVISHFINQRKNDRIGIVLFAGEVLMLCPLTTDYGVLTDFLDRAQIGILKDKTAIGDALAFSVSKLIQSKSLSKIIILLTDGANNAGKINPLKGAQLAKRYDIKTYTIGAGKSGLVPYPMETAYGIQYTKRKTPIDEDILRKIASMTKGKFFRATNTKELTEVYSEIDKMEKTPIETCKFVSYFDQFHLFVATALIFLLLEIVLSNSFLLKVP